MWYAPSGTTNYLGQLMQEPSFTQPSAPHQMSIHPDTGRGESWADIRANARADAGSGPERGGRTSVLNVLGTLADAFAEAGGAKPNYQATLDARADRERQAQQDAINNQYKSALIGQARASQRQVTNKTLGGLSSRLSQIYKAQGPQGLARAWEYAGPQLLGLSPEETQQYGAQMQADPEGVLSLFSAFGEQPEARYQEIGDRLVEIGPNGVREVYAPPAKPGAVRQITMDGPEGPGIYNIDAQGQPIGKVGGVVRAPTAPRQPTLADQRYQALVNSGMDPKRARLVALGLEKPAGSGTPSKIVQNRQQQNDRLDVATQQLTRMLSGDDWQGGSGIGNAVSDVWNAAAGVIGMEGAPERSRQKRDVATLRQVVTAALNDDSRVTEGDFRRIEELLPSGGVGSWFQSDQQARNAMAGLVRVIEDIRSRPLPGDPSAPAAAQEETINSLGNAADPLGLFGE